MKVNSLFLVVLAITLFFWSCHQDTIEFSEILGNLETTGTTGNNDTGQATVQIRLTDAPCDNCQQVNIDIQEIRLKLATDSSEWISIPTQFGIYDLLQYQNGVDTLIASGQVLLDELKEIRFVLGTENSVMVDSVLYPLETPSAQSSGLKVKIHQGLDTTTNVFVLDFDAAESVKVMSNGKYKLQPVIKLK